MKEITIKIDQTICGRFNDSWRESTTWLDETRQHFRDNTLIFL